MIAKRTKGNLFVRSFVNKVAVITGAASGMGRYLALLLAKMGCNVAICDVNEEELEKTSKMVSGCNISVSPVSYTHLTLPTILRV